MRHERDIPSKPTFTEWLELDPTMPYFEVLNKEAQSRGIDYESGKPMVLETLYDNARGITKGGDE